MMIQSSSIDVVPALSEAEAPSDDESGPSPACLVVHHEAWHTLTGALPAVHQAVNATISLVPEVAHGAIAIALSSDDEVRALNARFRGQDKPTNVLSFPAAGPEAGGVSGDIIIAYETLMHEAAVEHKPPLHHLAHLTVHGLLHLAGYDHHEDEEAEAMETLERHILATLGIHDPYRSYIEEDRRLDAAETR
jgi:probable rRNA maturation factor